MTFHTLTTRRYLSALALIGLILAGSFGLLLHRMEQNEDDGFVLNTAGRQRMLSQRVALLVYEIASSPPAKAADYSDQLVSALDQMEKDHEVLADIRAREGAPPEIQALYDGSGGIDERMEDFLAWGQRFLAICEAGEAGSPEARAAAETIAGIAKTGFLDELNAAVEAYQAEFEGDLDSFKRFQIAALATGLLVILLEALLVFQPMVRKTSKVMESLEKANEELRAFAFQISHDLRAPVASSLGLLGVARAANSSQKFEETGALLTRTEEALARMDSLIHDTVEVVRGGLEEVHPERVELEAEIDKILVGLSALPGFERLTVRREIDLEGDLMTMRLHVRQALENLISNSIKYANLNQASPKITIHAHQSDSTVNLSVRDNGIGIPQEYRDQLVGMFKRFHAGVSFGSGLGLYLAKQSAESLGGTLTYRPLERGSEFTLSWKPHKVLQVV